jgi:3-oxoacyl-[acyl-carrier-protein] synthase II
MTRTAAGSGARVLITGIGVVSPVGDNASDYWASLLQAALPPSQGFNDLADRIANRYMYVCDGDPAAQDAVGRTQQLSLHAVTEALGDAELTPPHAGVNWSRAGVTVGTTMGDESLLEIARAQRLPRGDYPFQVSAAIAERIGLCGPNLTISNACTSGLYAIDLAAAAIRSGEADLMLAGGVESASRIVLSCFNRLGALDDGVCRPFDQSRKGTVLGEGAAFVVLESEPHLLQRRSSARAYAEYLGSGWSCDAHQPTAPEPGGVQIERALRTSLAASALQPEAIDCVLPHGTGTPLNDSVEAAVLARVFGGNRQLPVLTAIKSKLGHSGGASGAFSLVTACLMLRHARVPPTANLRQRDQAFTMPMPVDAPVEVPVRHVLINAYAFGGNNITAAVGAL